MFRRCLGFSFVENKKSGELNSSLAGDLVERPHDGGASDSHSLPGSKDSCINSRPLSLRGAVQNMNSNLQTANSTTNALRILSRVAQVTLACTLQSCCSAGSWKCASHCVISSSPAGPEASPSPRESSPRTGLKVGSGYFEPKASLAPS